MQFGKALIRIVVAFYLFFYFTGGIVLVYLLGLPLPAVLLVAALGIAGVGLLFVVVKDRHDTRESYDFVPQKDTPVKDDWQDDEDEEW